jgi:hypothetical protein
MSVKDGIMQLATDAKFGITTTVTTTSTGIGTLINWIPQDIGKLTTVVGAIVSIFIVWISYQKHKRDKELAKLDKEIKLQQIEMNRRAIETPT